MPALMNAALLLSCALGAAPTSPERIRYDVEAALDPDAMLLRAHGTLTIPAADLSSPAEALLDLGAAGQQGGRRNLDLVSVKGGSASPQLRDGELAVVTLLNPVKGAATLELDWTVRLSPDGLKEMGYFFLPANDRGTKWYPEVVGQGGRRERFHDFRVALSYPEGYAALTSGQLVRRERVQGSVRESYSVDRAPSFALNIGKGYELLEVNRPKAHVVALCAPAERDVFRSIAELTADAIEWYARTYGFFPVGQIGLAPGAPQYGGGFPTTNVFYVHGRHRTPDFLRMITAHELGHYFWGYWVLSAAPEELDWVMLANGIWADQLYLAQREGKSVDDHWRAGDWLVRAIASRLSGNEQRLGLTPSEEEALSFDYNTDVRHAKGAVGLWLQARRIGTDRFLKLQRKLLAEFRDRPLSAGELAKRVEAAGAPGAVEFFQKYARGDASFGYSVEGAKSERAGSGWSCSATVRRTGTVPYPIGVELRSQTGEVVRRELSGAEAEQAIEAKLSAPLAEVRLDPDGVVPMRNGSHPGMRRAFEMALAKAKAAP